MDIIENKKVRIFISTAVKSVYSKLQRERIRAELSVHIEEKVERLKSAGATEADAVDQVLLSMGNSQELALELGKVHWPFFLRKEVIAVVALTASLAAVGTAISTARLFIRQADEAVENQFSQHGEAFAEDLRILREHPIFLPSGRSKDAAQFLGPRLNWCTGYSWGCTPGNPVLTPFSRFKMDSKVGDALKSHAVDAWAEKSKDAVLHSVDLRWMHELLAYDHWDLLKWGPVSHLLSTHPEEFPWYTLPIPDYAELRRFAEIRLAQGIAHGDVLPALREVRQLAILINSNELLVGALSEKKFLNMERSAFEYAVSRHLILPTEWQPVSQDLTTRWERSVWSVWRMLNIHSNPELLAQLFNQPGSVPGMCAAIPEAAVAYSLYRDRYATPWPLEFDFKPRLTQFNDFLEKARPYCRLTAADTIWGQPTFMRHLGESFVMGNHPVEDKIWVFASHLPYVRQVVLNFLDKNETQLLFSRYEARTAASGSR